MPRYQTSTANVLNLVFVKDGPESFPRQTLTHPCIRPYGVCEPYPKLVLWILTVSLLSGLTIFQEPLLVLFLSQACFVLCHCFLSSLLSNERILWISPTFHAKVLGLLLKFDFPRLRIG